MKKRKYSTIELDEECSQYCLEGSKLLKMSAEKFARYVLYLAIIKAYEANPNEKPSQKKNIASITQRLKRMKVTISKKQWEKLDLIGKKVFRKKNEILQ